MLNKVITAILLIPRLFNVLLILISPMALLMLIVGIIMTIDIHSTHRRLKDALDVEVLTAEAEITSCYPEEGFCYAQYVDISQEDRYDRLDLGYYPDAVREVIGRLEKGDVFEVRYSLDPYETEIVAADYYQEFVEYEGIYVEMAGIIAVSWFILILHPEVMLAMLVDDFGSLIDAKWKRMTGAA